MKSKKLNKKKIIHIAYYFPPIKSVGVNRSNRLANELASFFSSYTVCTTSNRKILPQSTLQIDDRVDVVEVPTFDFRTALSLLQKKESVHFDSGFKKKYYLNWLAKIIASFPFNIFLGQGSIIYILLGYKKVKQLIKNKPEDFVILSVFHPYADHLIAYLVKWKYPKVVWIADFKDLHIDPVYHNYYWKDVQLWFNKIILKKASFITTVSEGLAQNLRQFHDDVFVLPNGVTKIPEKVERYKDKFTISYTGAMFQDKRRPHLLLRAIEELIQEGKILKSKIRIQQAGRDLSIWKPLVKLFNLEDIFETHGVVSLDEAHLLQSKTHINLLLTTSHSAYKGVLTSKIFEYLAAANPVIVVINGPKDEIYEEAMSGINHLFIGYDKGDINKIKQFVLSYYHTWMSEEKYPRIEQKEWDSRYYWPKMINSFYSKIKKHISDV